MSMWHSGMLCMLPRVDDAGHMASAGHALLESGNIDWIQTQRCVDSIIHEHRTIYSWCCLCIVALMAVV